MRQARLDLLFANAAAANATAAAAAAQVQTTQAAAFAAEKTPERVERSHPSLFGVAFGVSRGALGSVPAPARSRKGRRPWT